MTAKTIIKKKMNKKVKEELLNSLRENDEDEDIQQFDRSYRTNKAL